MKQLFVQRETVEDKVLVTYLGWVCVGDGAVGYAE
jgi:hypothetical protein